MLRSGVGADGLDRWNLAEARWFTGAMPEPEPLSLFDADLADWLMAGPGGFRSAGQGVIESWGGSGLLWYRAKAFADFVLTIEWRITGEEDNSGIFIRIPALKANIGPAIEHG